MPLAESLIDWLPIMGVVAAVGASYGYYCLRTGVPTFPSMPVARDKIIALLRADMARQPPGKPYIIYDLGSGSGQLSWHIAKTLPQAQVIGMELSLVPWLRSVVRQKLTRQHNLQYRRMNFLTCNISNASALVMYLMDGIMERVSIKLHDELRPDTLVISNKFSLPGWEPEQTLPLESAFSKRLLVYRQTAAPQGEVTKLASEAA